MRYYILLVVSGINMYSMNYSNFSESGNVSGIDDTSLSDRSPAFYLASSLVLFIAIIAITTPATAVIITIIRKRDLHKYHYWFVANLMVCDILAAICYAPLHITLNLLKALKIARVFVSCNVVFGIGYIPLICSGFMVVNSAIDAALAITFPLDYENIMTKAKAIIMVVFAWIMSASVTLPLIFSPELDDKVDSLHSCQHTISALLILPVVRFSTALTIIGFNIYLYWSTFRAKMKLKNLVMDSHNPDDGVNSLQALMKKYKSLVRLSVTLLLIIIVDGVLRIIRIILAVTAVNYGFYDSSVFRVIFLVATWVEYVNHPVAYGLMLREVRQGICCN